MQDPIYADLATEAAYVALLRWVDDYCQDGIVDAERTVPVAAPSPLSPRSSPPVGSPLSARSPATHPSGREQGGLAWQQRAQRAWEAGSVWPLTRRLASSLTASGCWRPCVGTVWRTGCMSCVMLVGVCAQSISQRRSGCMRLCSAAKKACRRWHGWLDVCVCVVCRLYL